MFFVTIAIIVLSLTVKLPESLAIELLFVKHRILQRDEELCMYAMRICDDFSLNYRV